MSFPHVAPDPSDADFDISKIPIYRFKRVLTNVAIQFISE